MTATLTVNLSHDAALELASLASVGKDAFIQQGRDAAFSAEAAHVAAELRCEAWIRRPPVTGPGSIQRDAVDDLCLVTPTWLLMETVRRVRDTNGNVRAVNRLNGCVGVVLTGLSEADIDEVIALYARLSQRPPRNGILTNEPTP